jgi:hypothetical protein
MMAIIWTGFLFLTAAFLGFSLVLIHHWGYYGIKNNKKVFAKSLYFVGAILMLIIVAIFFALYETTL